MGVYYYYYFYYFYYFYYHPYVRGARIEARQLPRMMLVRV